MSRLKTFEIVEQHRKYKLKKIVKIILIAIVILIILRLMPPAEPERTSSDFYVWNEATQNYIER